MESVCEKPSVANVGFVDMIGAMQLCHFIILIQSKNPLRSAVPGLLVLGKKVFLSCESAFSCVPTATWKLNTAGERFQTTSNGLMNHMLHT